MKKMFRNIFLTALIKNVAKHFLIINLIKKNVLQHFLIVNLIKKMFSQRFFDFLNRIQFRSVQI
jgi:hypothetical protein